MKSSLRTTSTTRPSFPGQGAPALAASSHSSYRTQASLGWLTLVTCGLMACGSSGNSSGRNAGLEPSVLLGGHIGPAVAGSRLSDDGVPVRSGPGRFVSPLLDMYERTAAMSIALDLDGQYRSPASEGYERSIDRVLADLYGAGFGASDEYRMRVISEPMSVPAWTPIEATITAMEVSNGEVVRRFKVAGFNRPDDEQRLIIAEGAPSAQVSGKAVFDLESVTPGTILVTDKTVRNVEQEAVERGAAAIVSWFQLPYCQDPTGERREIDAIFQGSVRPGATVPSFYVSPYIADRIRLAAGKGARFELKATVKSDVRNLRTVVATILGSERPDEAVYVVSAVSGAGANDNAAGVGGIIEAARSLKRLIVTGQIERPRRTLHFVFGKEAEAGGTAMDAMGDTALTGIVADMIGANYTKTGAICLLERGWDPGAIVALEPDSHTPWGAGAVAEEDILPDGLAVILRQALLDVGEVIEADTGVPWTTREHPWEGGSDHDTFLGRGIPAALVWHFTDFTYSTSLDRLANVNPEELRRTAVAIVAAAAAIADAAPGDLPRYLESLDIERDLRLERARAQGVPKGLDVLWQDWFDGSEAWLRALTSAQSLPDFDGLRPLDSFEDGQ